MNTRYKHISVLGSLVLLVPLVVLLTLAGLSRAEEPSSAQGDKRSAVIYPAKVKPVTFSHALHVGTLGATCADCHAQVQSSRSALDNNLPREADCKSCHAIDRSRFNAASEAGKAPTRCLACHPGFDEQTGFVPRPLTPIPNLKFSHSAHLARQGDCATCHGNPVAGAAHPSQGAWLPTMRACLSCHDDKQADASCTTCHISEAGGIVKTEFAEQGKLLPSGSLRGAAHDMNFRTSHKYAAQNDQNFCSTCHTKDDCVDCHSGVIKPMDFHGGDYISMHTMDARRNTPDCSSCHRIQTFCQGCHTRMGVAADGKGSEFGPMPGFNFHPPGWTSSSLTGAPGPASHAFEAQRNIKQCASCHRESFCTRCHSNQPGNALRINPHPRDWRGSRRCNALLARNRRMCLRCHTEVQALDCSP
jgi:hypothetical protein